MSSETDTAGQAGPGLNMLARPNEAWEETIGVEVAATAQETSLNFLLIKKKLD